MLDGGAGARGEAELSVIFVDEQAIADLNERFLGGDRPDRRARVPDGRRRRRRGPPARPGWAGPGRAGRAAATRRRSSATSSCARWSPSRQARERGATLDDEMALLVVHGVLHLLNYDHAEPRRSGGDAAT